MSSDFLSQADIDQLMGLSSGEDESTKEQSSSHGPTAYKLGLQEKIVRGRMPALELINERIARNLRLDLFNLLQKTVEVSISPIVIQKYSEYIKHQVMPSALNVVNIKPLRGAALITLDPQLVFSVVDSMFGGGGQFHTRVEGRDFSDTEQRILLKILNVIFHSTETAWKSLYQINMEHVRTESQSQFINIATPSEPVITTSFTIELGAKTSTFNMCFPYSMIEPIKDILSSSLQSESGNTDLHWKKTLTRNLDDVQVELVVPLTTATITLNNLMKLKPGDVLVCTEPTSVTGLINNIQVLTGKVGSKNGHSAVQIDSIGIPK